ncbi:flagellin [Rhizobium pusense]|uniref:Flagellin n=1 Tax=Agrobacterium pusense TaxID=648995 RepID=A0A6H0ZR96_9HYPH|nr:flagellin [Agrobacterium pusense]MDH2091477.1 flagellin [Agrobacterium pusense]QIX22617.1 hypothetical protein FOB41_16450 [Agrobacterium pusense]WCK24528.1 flagellin [Agrobacterium pusense]
MAPKLLSDTAPATPSDAISLSQTLEGSLNQTTEALTRMRQLAGQSLGDTLSASQRDSLNNEFSAMKSEILRIAGSTSYNGENWLAIGTDGPKSFTFGDATLDQSRVALVSSSNPEDGILTRSYDGVSFSSDAFNISGSSSAEQRQNIVDTLDKIISGTSTARAAIGAFQGEVSEELNTRPLSNSGTYTPTSRQVDDFDTDFSDLRSKILQQAGVSVLSQANNLPQIAFSLLRG